MIKYNKADGTVVVTEGLGYWDLSHYPWGGDFKRFLYPHTLKVTKIISTYKDGSPCKVVANYNNKEIGLTISAWTE